MIPGAAPGKDLSVEDIIYSSQNSDLKLLKKISRARNRRKLGKIILEGPRIIKQAFIVGCVFDIIFREPEFSDSRINNFIKQSGVKVRVVRKKLLAQMADTVTPQGIMAIVQQPEYSFSDLFQEGFTCILVLDCVQDPGNMGTLIRTAAAAGAGGVIALKGCVDIYNQKVLRANMGALFSIPVIADITIDVFQERFTGKDFKIIACDLNTQQYYFEVDYDFPAIFIIGNEGQGIRPQLLQLADYKVKIPLIGTIESLNAAISGALVLYEYLRKNIENK